MFNYQSKKKVSLSNPIVFSFDLTDDKETKDYKCEQINFGFSSDRAKSTVDNSVHIFKNSIVHKNDVTDDVSCIKTKEGYTLISNCGYKIFDRNYIFLTNQLELSNTFDNCNFSYDFYIQNNNPSEEDIKILLDDQYYTKIDFQEIIPVVFCDYTFIDDVDTSEEQEILSFLDNSGDECVICSDYMFQLEETNFSSVLVMNNDDITKIYYTDVFPEKDCRIRCIISDNGRHMSISTAEKGTNNYNKSLSIMRDDYNKNNKDVFIRFSVLGKNNSENEPTSPISNITANF